MKSAIKTIALTTSLILVTACNSTAPINKTAITAINQEKFSQFHQYDANSNIALDYAGYGQILSASVIDLGMSDRYRITSHTTTIGTHLSSNPKPSTATEANRFYYDSYKDNPKKAIGWLNDVGNPYSNVILDKNGRLAIDWGVYGIPETFIVNSKGIIKYRHVGPITKKIYKKINKIMKENE